MSDLTGKHVLVTGGLGFIGSHTALTLVESGATVTIIDNLANSYTEVLVRMEKLLGDKYASVKYIEADITDRAGLQAVFKAQSKPFDAVVHFAAFKAVGESTEKPLAYYRNNIGGTVTLMEVMAEHKCKTLVYSSSCTVYGMPDTAPIDESTVLNAISPYGRTKLYTENLMRDVSASDPEWRIIMLRYFNPVAAHPSGIMGEHPVGVPLNLMPYVQQVAVGIRKELSVYGDDYPTRDGTCIRDYIHVMDLGDAHAAALARGMNDKPLDCMAINIGTGTGSTVFEMVTAFEKACGKKLPVKVVPRRAGDTVAVWAAPELAEKELGWKTKYDVEDMCRDQWNWASKYPKGYEEKMKE